MQGNAGAALSNDDVHNESCVSVAIALHLLTSVDDVRAHVLKSEARTI